MYNIPFNREHCEFANICPNYGNEEKCHSGCAKYQCVYVIFEEENSCNFPINWKNTTFINRAYGEDENEYKYLEKIEDNIVNWVKQGNNLYLYSSILGNGKTSWALELGYYAICGLIYAEPGKYLNGGNFGVSPVIYINVIEFLATKKDSFITKDKNIIKLQEAIKQASLVIWDDFGNNKLTDYEYNLIYSLLNNRIASSKSNIFTSNVIDEKLIENVGPRIASRVLETSEQIEFINCSFRKPKSTIRRK